MKTTLVLVALGALLLSFTAHAGPAQCEKYVGTLASNGRSVTIITWVSEYVMGHGYTDAGTQITGAFDTSCGSANFQLSEKAKVCKVNLTNLKQLQGAQDCFGKVAHR